MQQDGFLRRLADLSARCQRANLLTGTGFLTPAEQAQALSWAKTQPGCRYLLHGGHPECERKAFFFLPDYWEAEDFPAQQQISALLLTAHYGQPGHRDYLGALLAMGIQRPWLGDIWVEDAQATVFCLPSVAEHLQSIERVGRVTVSAKAISLTQVQPPKRRRQVVSFTLQSLRLDSTLAGMFHLSRAKAADLIRAGAASVNHLPCLRVDAPVKPGDVLSLQGHGKGQITQLGGVSRKGRQYIQVEIFI